MVMASLHHPPASETKRRTNKREIHARGTTVFDNGPSSVFFAPGLKPPQTGARPGVFAAAHARRLVAPAGSSCAHCNCWAAEVQTR